MIYGHIFVTPKILFFSLKLEFYQKQLPPSLIPTFRAPYARQIKKVSNLRNLICIVPFVTKFVTKFEFKNRNITLVFVANFNKN